MTSTERTPYIPTTEIVRDAYAWSGHDNYVESNREYRRADFDRWLADHDRKVKAQALMAHHRWVSTNYPPLSHTARETILYDLHRVASDIEREGTTSE